MSNRRQFLGQVIGGAAAVAVSGSVSPVLGASERIRIGLIGAGSRGLEVFRTAVRCPGVEGAAVADVYTRRLDEARKVVPGMAAFQDFRRLLDDRTIDAVIIATPQHQHALNFVPAIGAGKDVYQEKTLAFTPDHARRMKKALEGSGRVVQVGMQMISGKGQAKVRELATPERMGTLTSIHVHHFRNAPHGGWLRPIPPDCDEAHVDWKGFEGEAAPHPFDPQRYMNWRFFWDYSGGNVFENMVHPVGFWYKALGLGIPESVTMSGANYLSPRMEVPDAMNVTLLQPEKLMFTWNSIFSNDFYGEGFDLLLGTKGTVMQDESDEVRYWPQGEKRPARPEEGPRRGYTDSTEAHLLDFFSCMRTRKEPICPFEVGYRAAIACQMAIRSYREGRTVRWDAQREEIV